MQGIQFDADYLTWVWIPGCQLGVAMASAAEVSFNWTGFISAMVSNLTFSFRAVLGKKCALLQALFVSIQCIFSFLF